GRARRHTIPHGRAARARVAGGGAMNTYAANHCAIAPATSMEPGAPDACAVLAWRNDGEGPEQGVVVGVRAAGVRGARARVFAMARNAVLARPRRHDAAGRRRWRVVAADRGSRRRAAHDR